MKFKLLPKIRTYHEGLMNINWHPSTTLDICFVNNSLRFYNYQDGIITLHHTYQSNQSYKAYYKIVDEKFGTLKYLDDTTCYFNIICSKYFTSANSKFKKIQNFEVRDVREDSKTEMYLWTSKNALPYTSCQ